jgi:hypothetical protein
MWLVCWTVLAQAWEPTGRAFLPEGQPLQVGVEGACPVPECLGPVAAQLQALEEPECADLRFEGPERGLEAPELLLVLQDPEGLVPAGEAVLVQWTPGGGFTPAGASIQASARVYFSDRVVWTDDAALATGEACSDAYSFDAAARWGLGAALGFELAPLAPCQPAEALGLPDAEAMLAAYGPGPAKLTCGSASGSDIGGLPFQVDCALEADPRLQPESAAWSFGDGGTAVGAEVSHTYTEPGNFTVRTSFSGACVSEATAEVREVGLLTACGAPRVAIDLFHHGGLDYSVVNRTDVSVYGCLSEITWWVYEGQGRRGKPVVGPLRAWEPRFTVPAEGAYTVVGEASGLGGTGGAQRTFEAVRSPGDALQPFSWGAACNHASSTGLGAGSVIVLAGWLRRRRRAR